MRTIVKNISLILALVAVVYLVANYTGIAQTKVMDLLHISGSSVQGASTQRAQEVSEKMRSDLASLANEATGQILNIRVSDVISGASRLQKIPHDVNAVKEFAKEQLDSMLKSKKILP